MLPVTYPALAVLIAYVVAFTYHAVVPMARSLARHIAARNALPTLAPAGYLETRVHVLQRKVRLVKRSMGG